VKYGYKSLKRVGLIRFQDERPSDYWAERGYDWYAGLRRIASRKKLYRQCTEGRVSS